MKLVILAYIVCTFFFFQSSINANSLKDCKDQKSWSQLAELVKKYPDDIPLQILHALKMGLCTKIEEGSITYDEATILMDDMTEVVINKRSKEEMEEKKKGL